MAKSYLPSQLTTATSFLKEVRHELSLVVWPSRQTTLKLTAVVIGVSLFIALYIGLLDVIFTNLVNTLILR